MVEFLLVLKFCIFTPIVGVNPRVFGGGMEVVPPPPPVTREVVVSDGGQWYEHPEPVCAWVGGKEADKAPR